MSTQENQPKKDGPAEALRSSDWLAALFAKQPDKMITRTIEITESRVHELVPHGIYCYDKRGTCPFWSRFDGIYPSQSNGYCSLMERGDWMASESGGTSLLWDQCKECGINDSDDDSANTADEHQS